MIQQQQMLSKKDDPTIANVIQPDGTTVAHVQSDDRKAANAIQSDVIVWQIEQFVLVVLPKRSFKIKGKEIFYNENMNYN